MNYGICIVSVAAVRAEASDRAEMVTQLLFGEKVEVTETTTKWLKIKNKYDDYEGWIDPKMLLKIEEKIFLEAESDIYAADLVNLAIENNLPITLTIGAHLLNFNVNLIQIEDKKFE